jgi:hypothetical protein
MCQLSGLDPSMKLESACPSSRAPRPTHLELDDLDRLLSTPVLPG